MTILPPTLFCALLSFAALTLRCRGHAFYAGFEGRQTHPIAVQADGARLFALNTPGARLSVFDITNATNPVPVLVAEIPVGLEPVSVRQRTADEVWVVNEVSDSISIVSLSAGCVVETLQVPDEPADVIFANGRAFVTCARNHLLRVLDPATRTETAVIPLEGLMPRAMALSADGTRLFAACLLSGNGTTMLPAALAPAPPAPANPALPPAPQTGLIVSTGDPRISWTVTDHDVAEINTATNALVCWHSGAGTNLFDLAVHPVTGDVWVANTDARNAVRFSPNIRAHAVDNRLSRIALTPGTVTVFDLNPGVDYSVLPNPVAAATALAQPTGLVWSPDGASAWVAAFGSDRVAQVAADGTVLARVDVRQPAGNSRVMRGPRGLVLHPSLPRLYVLNRVSNTITVLDTGSLTILAETGAASRHAIPDYIREGRGFVFDARLSGNGTMSCASCHIDGDHDGLAWDLGDPGGEMATAPGKNLASGSTIVMQRPMHPMKGPMLTRTLRSGILNSPYNWRGDTTLIGINANFSAKLGATELSLTDLQVVFDYLVSLQNHPNPNRPLDNTLPATLNGGNPLTGQARFNASASKCVTCHSGTGGSNANIDDPVATGSTDYIETPLLQLLYQREGFTPAAGTTLTGFGYRHDGSSATLPLAHPYAASGLAAADYAHVAAWLMCFDTATLPVVGASRTVTVANRNLPSLTAALATMEQQAATGLADLVARGRLEGRRQVFLADPFAGEWLTDSSEKPGITLAILLARLQPGDALTFMGVIGGTGHIYSVDWNDNEIEDGDEPSPVPVLSGGAGSLTLHSPADNGWVPEWSASLPGTWETLTIRPLRDESGAAFPDVSGPVRRFFRLRRTW